MTHEYSSATPAPGTAPARHLRRHRTRRLVAAGTAGAVVFGTAGLGLGLVLEPHLSTANQAGRAPVASTQPGASYDGGSSFNPGIWTDPPIGTPPQTTAATPASTDQISGLVGISTTLGYANGEAAGTGMVLTTDGEVVTNHHVVAGATSIRATVMSTGRTYTANVVGTDAADDVAVLQLQGASGLTPARIEPSAVRVGDKVTAVGDANGTTDELSAASGRISAVDQYITTQADGTSAGEALNGLIEITSDVISGDSGGATYDSDGAVIGMTTTASISGSGIDGYAIPVAKVLSVAAGLESGVRSSTYAYGYPAFLGIALAEGTGTRVAGSYPGTTAARAGLAAGDTITRVGTTSVHTANALEDAIRAHSPGDRVTVTWTGTRGQSHTARVTLGTGPIV